MEVKDRFYYGNEVRLCFESINIDENGNRDIHSAVFYGDVEKMKFTAVGIPNVQYSDDSHEYWLCSKQ